MQGERLIGRRYRLAERIGSGGMGVVWRAVDERTGRTVAMKQARLPDAAGGRMLRREARLAAGLDHPNVVGFLDVVTEDDELWLVLEYVPSRSLSALIDDGPLPPSRAAEIGVQVAGALAAVHARGIVHRDVKPGNVLISAEDGSAKLTDFGISRSVATDETLTESPVVGGTPGYLAPCPVPGVDAVAELDRLRPGGWTPAVLTAIVSSAAARFGVGVGHDVLAALVAAGALVPPDLALLRPVAPGTGVALPTLGGW